MHFELLFKLPYQDVYESSLLPYDWLNEGWSEVVPSPTWPCNLTNH